MNHVIIKVPIYDCRVNIITVDNLKKVEDKFNLTNCEGYDAITFRILNEEKVFEYYVAFEGKPKLKIIHHEVTHLVNYIFKDSCVELDLVNDETQAYFSSYLFVKVLKKLKLNNK